MTVRIAPSIAPASSAPVEAIGARLPHKTANARIDFVPGKPGKPGSEKFQVTLYKYDPAIGKVEPGLVPTGRVKVKYNVGSSNVSFREQIFTPKTGNVASVRQSHLAEVQVEVKFRGRTYWAPVDVAFR